MGIGAALGAIGLGEAAADVGATAALTAGATEAAGVGTATALSSAAAAAGPSLAATAAGGGLTGALGGVSLLGTVGSTIMGAMGQQRTAAANAAAANYQAQVAANNQIIAQQNARYAAQAAQANAQAQDFQTRRLLGAQIAAQGASGIDLTTGSPFDVTQSTRQLGRLDTARLIQEGNLQQYGYQTQATSFGAQSALDRAQAGYAQTAGTIGTAGTLLGGASSFATKWLDYQRTGVPGVGAGGF